MKQGIAVPGAVRRLAAARWMLKKWCGIEETPDPGFLGRWMDIVKWERCRLIYITVPKTANTSLKTDISRASGILDVRDEQALIRDPQQIHELLGAKRGVALSPEDLSKVSGYFIFSVVRNPYHRFVSFYTDKVLSSGWNPGMENKIFNTYGISRDHSDEVNIKNICSYPDHLAEFHFRSQYSILTSNDVFLPHAVFRFEQLDEMWPVLKAHAAKYGIELPVHLSHTNKSHTPKCDFLSQEAKKIIRERYARDFEFFDYQDEKP